MKIQLKSQCTMLFVTTIGNKVKPSLDDYLVLCARCRG